MIQRNDTKNLRPVTCNVTESLDNILIKSVKKEHVKKRSKYCFSKAPGPDHPLRARHHRFFPTKEQKLILRSLIADAQHAYNKCVAQSKFINGSGQDANLLESYVPMIGKRGSRKEREIMKASIEVIIMW